MSDSSGKYGKEDKIVAYPLVWEDKRERFRKPETILALPVTSSGVLDAGTVADQLHLDQEQVIAGKA